MVVGKLPIEIRMTTVVGLQPKYGRRFFTSQYFLHHTDLPPSNHNLFHH